MRFMYVAGNEVLDVEAQDRSQAIDLVRARHGWTIHQGVRPSELRHFVPPQERCAAPFRVCINRRGPSGLCGLHERNQRRETEGRARQAVLEAEVEEWSELAARLLDLTGVEMWSMRVGLPTLRSLVKWCTAYAGHD